MNSIFASSSSSNKVINQDYHISFRHSSLDMNCIVVADGIGSHPRCELSSKYCTKKLAELLKNISNIRDIDFISLFSQIQSGLVKYVNETDEISIEERNSSLLGTTLICLVETEDYYDIAYVGNGSIWQISANFNQFSENQYVPWNSINLLNPHTSEEEGKSVLYNFFSKENKTISPSCLRVSKDKFFCGEIIMIATDGVYTNDPIPAGKDDNDTIWIKADDNMLRLYTKLNNLFSTETLGIKNEDLLFFIEQYINSLKQDNMMFDDTTLGLIISEKALDYQNKIAKKNGLNSN